MSDGLRISDTVIMRIVQIIQEGMMTFTDSTDLLREMRLQPDEDNETLLVLTSEYKALVAKSHDDLLAKADRLRQERDTREEFADWVDQNDSGWKNSDV